MECWSLPHSQCGNTLRLSPLRRLRGRARCELRSPLSARSRIFSKLTEVLFNTNTEVVWHLRDERVVVDVAFLSGVQNPIVNQFLMLSTIRKVSTPSLHSATVITDPDQSEETVWARLTPETARDRSQGMFLSVDINENGRRRLWGARYPQLFGTMMTLEAMASQVTSKKGTTSITNPDPAGDNYMDPFHNPTVPKATIGMMMGSLISIWVLMV